MGVVSLGPSNGSNNSAGDTSFLQASSSVLKLAQGVNLDMTVGSFQEQWSQAFADYAATASSHWHKAEREFTQLAHSYPDFQAVQPFLTYAQTQAQTEPTNLASVTPTQVHNTGSGANSPTSGGHSSGLAAWQAWVILVAAAVLFLVVVGSLFTVLVRKRERKIILTQNAAGGKEPATVTVPQSSGAPTITGQSSATNTKGRGQNTLSLKVWPCGHMNQPNAVFCSVCGELAPVPPKSVP